MKTFAFLGINNLYDEYKRAGIAGISCGRYNGYVGIIEGAGVPLSRQGGCEDYETSLDNLVSVHGGITFDGKFDKGEEIIPLTETPADWWKYRIVGFDCANFGDTEDNCPFEFAKQEALNLQRQMEEIINKEI
jgi:hypothetical protein